MSIAHMMSTVHMILSYSIHQGVVHAVCYWYRMVMAGEGDRVSAERSIERVMKRQRRLEKNPDPNPNPNPKRLERRRTKCTGHMEKQEEEGDEDEDEEDEKEEEDEEDQDEEENGEDRGSALFPYILDTGPSSSRPTHYRQAASLLLNSRPLIPGDVFTVEVGVDLSFGVMCTVLSD